MYQNRNLRDNLRFRGDRPYERRSKISKDLFVWAVVLVLVAAIALGETGQVSLNADGSESIDSVNVVVSRSEDVRGGSKAGLPTVESASLNEAVRRPIKFNKGLGVREALAMLGSTYHKNIVPSPKVDGQLAFTNLFDVTFEEAMEAVLGTNFKCEQDGNLIKVYTAEEYKKVKADNGRMIHKVFTLYYISAAEAMKLVSPVLSRDENGKLLGLIQCSSPAEIGIPVGESISSNSQGGDKMAVHDRVVIYDFPENIAKAEEVIKSVDIRPKQILVEATILSATLTEGMEFGVDLSLLKGVSLTGTEASDAVYSETVGTVITSAVSEQSVLGQIAGGVTGTPIETSGFATVGGSGLRVGITMGNVTAFITALESVTDVTILANPKILAVNKQLGQVYIGKKIGYREGNTVSQGGVVTEGKVRFLDTGTKLSFRPYIGNDGYIRMDIHPKDSSGELNAIDKVPNEQSTELATNVIVKDGETIVIGGLFRDVTNTSRKQVPLLGDIPLLGGLFRGTNDSSRREEVIVLLTPHIITEPDQTNGRVRADDVSRKRFGAKSELQWTGRARLAEDCYTRAVQYYVGGDNEAAMRELETAVELRPTYLEAIRLKERIIGERGPDEAAKIERNVRGAVEQEKTKNWLRR